MTTTSNSAGLPVRITHFQPQVRYDLTDFKEAGIWEEPSALPNTDLRLEDDDAVDLEAALRAAIKAGLAPWALAVLKHGQGDRFRSSSEADFAVVTELLRYLPPAQAEDVWRSSTLGHRAKVQSRADYRERTLRAALAQL